MELVTLGALKELVIQGHMSHVYIHHCTGVVCKKDWLGDGNNGNSALPIKAPAQPVAKEDSCKTMVTSHSLLLNKILDTQNPCFGNDLPQSANTQQGWR